MAHAWLLRRGQQVQRPQLLHDARLHLRVLRDQIPAAVVGKPSRSCPAATEARELQRMSVLTQAIARCFLCAAEKAGPARWFPDMTHKCTSNILSSQAKSRRPCQRAAGSSSGAASWSATTRVHEGAGETKTESSQGPRHGVASRVEPGEEEHADVRQHPLVRQRLPLRVPDAQQVRANAAIIICWTACITSAPTM